MKEKQAQVRRAGSWVLPDPLDGTPGLWLRLARLYDLWLEPRHSLVHRRAELQPDGTLVGVDRAGQRLTPIAAAAQEAFARAMYLVSEAVLAGSRDTRRENAAKWEVDQLNAHHGLGPLGAWPPAAVVPLVRANLQAIGDGRFMVDVPSLRRRINQTLPDSGPEVDLELYGFVDGRLVGYRVRLEELSTASRFEIDPTEPSWQQRELGR
jgi:hypothetical protein